MPTSHEGHRERYKSLTPPPPRGKIKQGWQTDRKSYVLGVQQRGHAEASGTRWHPGQTTKNGWMSMLGREEPSRLKETKQIRMPGCRSTACLENNRAFVLH